MEAKKILVIDDEQDIRETLKNALSEAGFTVETASEGTGGIEAARTFHPDLIMLDLMLPGIDGFAVVETIKGDDWAKNLKVIMLSAMESIDIVSKAVEQGGYDYLVKTDWKISDIVEKVKSKLA